MVTDFKKCLNMTAAEVTARPAMLRLLSSTAPVLCTRNHAVQSCPLAASRSAVCRSGVCMSGVWRREAGGELTGIAGRTVSKSLLNLTQTKRCAPNKAVLRRAHTLLRLLSWGGIPSFLTCVYLRDICNSWCNTRKSSQPDKGCRELTWKKVSRPCHALPSLFLWRIGFLMRNWYLLLLCEFLENGACCYCFNSGDTLYWLSRDYTQRAASCSIWSPRRF